MQLTSRGRKQPDEQLRRGDRSRDLSECDYTKPRIHICQAEDITIVFAPMPTAPRTASLDELFHALADPTRLRLLNLIRSAAGIHPTMKDTLGNPLIFVEKTRCRAALAGVHYLSLTASE